MNTTDLPLVLVTLVRQMLTLKHQYLDHLGLGAGQAAVLVAIMDCYGITERDLCRLMKLDKSTVSRSVTRLSEAGYVTRKPNPSDRRSHHLLATKMAMAFKPQFDHVDQTVAAVLLDGFQDAHCRELAEFLRRASANVNHVLHSPPESRFKRYMSRIEF